MNINKASEDNPVATQQPLKKRQNISLKKPSPFLREYRCNRGGLLVEEQDSLSNRGGLLVTRFCPIIPANLKLKPRANKFSRNMTKSEQLIWFNILSKRQLSDYKFTKQKQVSSYILDFYCSELLLAVEVDGASHSTPSQILYDQIRTKFLNSLNITVVRLTNHDIQNNLAGVRAYLLREVLSQKNLSLRLK